MRSHLRRSSFRRNRTHLHVTAGVLCSTYSSASNPVICSPPSRPSIPVPALTVSEDLSAQTDNDIVVSFQNINNTSFVFVTDHGVNILASSIATSQVKSITVATAAGNDKVDLSNVGSAQYTQLFQTPLVDGGDGADRILGTKLADLLYGVGGDDVLIGVEGGDHLYGGEVPTGSLATTAATTPR